MKITIEPTTDQSQRSVDATQLKVSVEHPCDDLDIWQLAELLAAAVLALGYHPSNVDYIINTKNGPVGGDDESSF